MSTSLKTEAASTVVENIRPLYRNKNFILLILARFVSQMGDSVHYMALTWYILHRIGTGAAVGTIMIISTLPGVLMAPFTGVLADWFDRRKIMITMDVIRGGIAICLGYLVLVNQAPLWTLYVGTGLLAACSALYFPASGALFPNLVHESQLLKANNFGSLLGNTTAILGPVVAGFLLGAVDTQGCFIINGGTFVFASLCEAFIVIPRIINTTKHSVKEFATNLLEGFTFVYKLKALFAMLLFGLTVNFFFFPIQNVIQPIVIQKILGLSATQYGTITAFFPMGMLMSTIILQILPQPNKKHRLFLWSMFAQSMGLILFALPILPMIKAGINPLYFLYIYCIITGIRGLAFGLTNVPMQVVYQRLTPDAYRGRVFALQGMFFSGVQPIAMGVAGFAVDVIPAYAISIFAGVFMGLACLVMFRVKEIKTI